MSEVNFDSMMDVPSEEILGYLEQLLDKPVLVAIPLGKKGLKGKKAMGWTETTYETMQWPEIRLAAKRGGNLGVVLGPSSSNLVALDLDSDEEMERFFEWAPWANNTLISVGSKGCQCWFYINGNYPNKRAVWKTSAETKKPTVEFRGGDGIQSVIWGKHPDTGDRYKTNGRKPLHISYYDLEEYHLLLREENGTCDEDVHRPGQDGDFEWTKSYKKCNFRELDLLGLLKEVGIGVKLIASEEGIDKYAIKCPWIDAHTSEEGERDTAISVFEPRGKWWPAFTCFHAHCAERGLKDLLEWLQRDRRVKLGTIQKYCGVERQRIEITDCSDLIEAPPIPAPIIDGLLYPELKMLIASASKIGKTWLGIDLGLSLAQGGIWMGFDTCQSNVLYLNLEMPVPWFYYRICEIKRVKGLGLLPKKSFQVANLRGSNALEGNLDAMYEVCEKHGPFEVIIYDPIYKLLGDLDENKATDVAKLLGMIDGIGRETKAASVLIHHFAKGNPWDKKAGDRASGSGVFLRDPDTYMAITELGEENSGTARVDCRLRCSKPLTSFGIRWSNYQWKRDPNVEINRKKAKDGESKSQQYANILLNILKENAPNWMAKSVLIKRATTTYGVPEGGSFDRALESISNQLDKRKVGREMYYRMKQ